MHVHQSTYLWYPADCPPNLTRPVLVATVLDHVLDAIYHAPSGTFTDAEGGLIFGVTLWSEWPSAPLVSEPAL